MKHRNFPGFLDKNPPYNKKWKKRLYYKNKKNINYLLMDFFCSSRTDIEMIGKKIGKYQDNKKKKRKNPQIKQNNENKTKQRNLKTNCDT